MESKASPYRYAQLFQDLNITDAMNLLKEHPDELHRVIQQTQDNLYKDVTRTKDNEFSKVYGELRQTSHHAIDPIIHHDNKAVIDTEANNAKRQYEINQWTTANKSETLFVYQFLFISLCISIILTFLWKRGLMGNWFYGLVMLLIISIFVFMVVYKSQYTTYVRDGRYWNRRNFIKEGGIPIPIVPVPSCSSIEKGVSDLENNTSTEFDKMAKNINDTYNNQ
jgi:hypothetical protein